MMQFTDAVTLRIRTTERGSPFMSLFGCKFGGGGGSKILACLDSQIHSRSC